MAFAAARLLREGPRDYEVVESAETGLALLDHLEGFDQAVLLDAIFTGKHGPGTVLEFGPDDFKMAPAPSNHFAGLPEMIKLAQRLRMRFPKDLRILAMEVDNPIVFRQTLTPEARKALPAFVERARRLLSA